MELTTTNKAFEGLSAVISQRRTRKVATMNGKAIPKGWIVELLQLADCAPTHGRTEPWRFYVLEGESFRRFCGDHAAMYWENTPIERRRPSKLEQLKNNSIKASHLIIVAMKRSMDSKIPENEELAATSAAVQNMLLGAEALGLAAIWSTGGMAYSEQMKAYLKLAAEDRVVGFVYLGFSDDDPKTAARKITLEGKVVWL